MEGRLKRIVLTVVLLCPLPSVWAQEQSDQEILEDIVSPDIERRDIKDAKIDSENIEIGVFGGVLSMESLSDCFR